MGSSRIAADRKVAVKELICRIFCIDPGSRDFAHKIPTKEVVEHLCATGYADFSSVRALTRAVTQVLLEMELDEVGVYKEGHWYRGFLGVNQK